MTDKLNVEDYTEAVKDLLYPDESAGESQPEVSEGENPPVDTPEAAGGDDGPEPVEIPATLGALAERLGVSEADLYDSLEVPRAGGREPIKLGALKDLEATSDEVAQLRAETEDQRSQMQAERLQFHQELQVLGSALKQAQETGKFDESTLQQAAVSYQQSVERENAMALQVAPELGTDAGQQKVETALKRYGAPAGVLKQGLPAWMQVAFNRLATLEGRVEAAKAAETKPKPVRTRPVGKPKVSQQVLRDQVKGGTMEDMNSAVQSLLYGSR